MIVKRLMDETKSHHESVQESEIVDRILGGGYSVENIEEFLLKAYLFHRAIEFELDIFAQLSLLKEIGYTPSKNTALLLSDMEKLDIDFSSFSYKLPSFNLKSIYDILGSFYVIEMCRVSFFMLFQDILVNYKKAQGINFEFFNLEEEQGNNSEDKWHLLTTTLEKHALDEDCELKILSAAKSCYKLCKHVMEMPIKKSKH